MMDNPLKKRSALADKLRALRQRVAEDVTEDFFRRHPDWLERYGEPGRRRGVEDAIFHINFLAAAIEGGTTSSFEEYARWTSRMLDARRIAPHFVAENFQQIEDALLPHLQEEEQATVRSFVAAGVKACEHALELESDDQPQPGLALTRSLYLQAILSGQRGAAANIALEALRKGNQLPDIYADVLQESMYQVGRKWAANEITVAEEHMATAITQYVVAQLYAQLKPATVRRGNLVMTGVEGEMHQIGANMVADVLESDGWDVRFLGTNMPHAGILEAVEHHEADVLGISSTMTFNVPQAIRLVREVRDKMAEKAPRIVLGGGAFRSVPELWREIGATGGVADVRAAQALFATFEVPA